MSNAKKQSSPKFARLFLVVLLGLVLVPFGSLFHAEAADTNVNVKVCYPDVYPAPTITSPEDGAKTQEQTILVMGQATPGISVFVYVNDNQVGKVTSDQDGVYVSSVGLAVGQNSIKTSTNNDCHAPAFSEMVNVEREAPPPDPEDPPVEEPNEPSQEEPEDSVPPPLTLPPIESPIDTTDPSQKPQPRKPGWPVILSPRTGSTINRQSILVIGQADPNTLVKIIRGKDTMAQVTSGPDGRFAARIPLHEGENRILAQVGEGRNKRSSNLVYITYVPVTEKKDEPLLAFTTTAIIGTTLAVVGLTVLALFGEFGPLAHLASPVHKFFGKFKW